MAALKPMLYHGPVVVSTNKNMKHFLGSVRVRESVRGTFSPDTPFISHNVQNVLKILCSKKQENLFKKEHIFGKYRCSFQSKTTMISNQT